MNYIKLIRILVLVCVLVPFSNATVVNNQAESFTTSDSINIAYDVYYDNAVNNANFNLFNFIKNKGYNLYF